MVIQGFRNEKINIKKDMTDIFEIFADLSYFGVFLVLVGVNSPPILMPPTWIILSSFYAFDPSLNPIILSIVGATGATVGRFILKKISSYFRRFVGSEQKSNLDIIGNFLNKKKHGYVIASFLFAATPLPSNMLFITYGLMKAKSFGIYVGFWFGRATSYFVMLSISNIVLTPFLKIFEERYVGILLLDGISISSVIFFICIDWALLITQRKLKFVKPKIWRF
jgi:membrane protein DedA with SNARE-associated domain